MRVRFAFILAAVVLVGCGKPPEKPEPVREETIDHAARAEAEEMARGEWLIIQAVSPEGEIDPLNLILVNGRGREKRLTVSTNHLRWHFWTVLRFAKPGEVWIRFDYSPDGVSESWDQNKVSDFLTPRVSRGIIKPSREYFEGARLPRP